MGICWFCYWGWHAEIFAIYSNAVESVGESVVDYGPGHIVWADENFEDESIDFCLAECAQPEKYADRMSVDDIEVVRESLLLLKATPQEWRTEPDGYEEDDDNPADYPPSFATVDSLGNPKHQVQPAAEGKGEGK